MALMERKIIQIDENTCNGCGACVDACHEGAIQMVNGKAKLVSDIYCDGLGDCLGPCPTGAITIVTRPAGEYDADAVAQRMAQKKTEADPLPCGCPGGMSRELKPGGGCPGSAGRSLRDSAAPHGGLPAAGGSELMNWPVQLRLVPPDAPYLKGAHILLAADCVPVAVPDFHTKYLKDKPVLIACPKLDDNESQTARLANMIRIARPASILVARMEVPCCGGLVRVAQEAVARSGENVPIRVIVLGVDGREK